MLLIAHIVFAFISILTSVSTLTKPTKNKFLLTYFLTFGATVSGIILTVLDHTVLARTCISGLFYLTFILTSLKVAKYRLT